MATNDKPQRQVKLPKMIPFHRKETQAIDLDKAMFGLGKLDDFQLNALRGSRLDRCVSSVGLVDEGQFDRLASRLLHAARQLADLRDLAHWPESPRTSADAPAYRRLHALYSLCGAWLHCSR